MTGLIYGFFTFTFLYFPLGCLLAMGLLSLLGAGQQEGNWLLELLGGVLAFVLPIAATVKTSRLANQEIENRLSSDNAIFWKKLKKFIHSYFISGFLLIVIIQNGGLEEFPELEGEFVGFGLAALTPLLIAVILTFAVPPINKIVKNIITRNKSNTRKSRPVLSHSSTGSWFKDKIVAPIIVGVVVGLISFLITGQFSTGGEIGLISIPVTLVFNSNS